tara:strand:- start:5745 stop:6377 length:633 start_codon:yes stop_codon:yes gene_type:complete
MLEPNLDLEKEAAKKGFNCIAGLDEAGRGPLAGPVVVACVILGKNWCYNDSINDSKKISKKKRESLYEFITKNALSFKIVSISSEEIDKMNILQATLHGMSRCLAEIRPVPDYVLVDGNRFPNTNIRGKAVVRGDSISKSIAAASILAKVTRDRFMIDLSKQFPEWSFDKHKGYPTKLHKKLILKYGSTPLHRKSFKIKHFQENFLVKNQ